MTVRHLSFRSNFRAEKAYFRAHAKLAAQAREDGWEVERVENSTITYHSLSRRPGIIDIWWHVHVSPRGKVHVWFEARAPNDGGDIHGMKQYRTLRDLLLDRKKRAGS